MFWRLDTTDADDRFTLTAEPFACVGPAEHQFFMGGVGMAAAVDALQTWSGKPLLWATIQFVNHGRLGDEIDITLKQVGGGRNVVQASATLSRGDVVLQTVVAALGARLGEPDRQFAAMPPNVLKPEDCPIKQDEILEEAGNLIDQFERRTALEDAEAGVEWMWIRPKVGAEISAPLLALMSDFFLGAHERSRAGTSLDNTIRLCALRPTEWVLAVTQFASFTRGAAHGNQWQFAEDGTLLSVSSQTGLLPRRV